MSQKKITGHPSNCQATTANAVVTSSVPSKKSKEEAKKPLYINRI
jgi:hypothetical protein